MRVNNEVYTAVKIKWDGITLPLKAGTPVNIGGNIANGSTAIGLVPQNYFVRPIASDEINILVGGDVDLAEVEKSSGLTLTTDAKAGMSGIKFHLPDGSVNSSYTLPAASDSTLGGVKVGSGLSIESDGTLSASGGGGGALKVNIVVDGETASLDKTWGEIFDALSEGQYAYIVNEQNTSIDVYTILAMELDGDYYVDAYRYDGAQIEYISFEASDETSYPAQSI